MFREARVDADRVFSKNLETRAMQCLALKRPPSAATKSSSSDSSSSYSSFSRCNSEPYSSRGSRCSSSSSSSNCSKVREHYREALIVLLHQTIERAEELMQE